MNVRTGEKQHTRLINDQFTRVRPGDLQPSLSENMQMIGVFADLILRESAKRPRIKHPGRERELFEEGRQSIHMRL
jgi:hypothetical protein